MNTPTRHYNRVDQTTYPCPLHKLPKLRPQLQSPVAALQYPTQSGCFFERAVGDAFGQPVESCPRCKPEGADLPAAEPPQKLD